MSAVLCCLCSVRLPPDVNVTRLTPSAFHLSWPQPTDAGQLAHYRVTLEDSASGEQWTAELDRTSIRHCFTGLESSGAYRVDLTAAYIDGSSASSGDKDIPTEGGSSSEDGCSAIIPVAGTCV